MKKADGSLREFLRADWAANRGSPHIQVLLVFLRLAQFSRVSDVFAIRATSGVAFSVIYRAASLFMFSIDVPVSTRIGKGFAIRHGMSLVIHSRAVIGDNVTVRQGVTIGSKVGGYAPVIESDVSIGPNSTIIGAITIGARSTIGAGSVVVKSVEAGDVVAGNPARSLKHSVRSEQLNISNEE